MRLSFCVFLVTLLYGVAGAVSHGQPVPFAFELVASWGYSGGFPTRIVPDPTDPTRLFVLEQTGRVRIVQSGAVLPDAFLDLSAVITDSPDEEGLLGMAFAPDYAVSGIFYVHYYHQTRHGMLVERYRRSATDPARADPLSGETVLLHQRIPSVHLAGWIDFSPIDGLLYIAQGENSIVGRADLVNNIAGKILRIDVTPGLDAFPEDPNRNFGVPAANPFAATPGARPEILSMGLRNPFCCSFDAGGDLYIGDVGVESAGAVYVVPRAEPPEGVAPALNFGWPCRERGSASGQAGCTTVRPITTFAMACNATGDALIGGFVYRGSAMPDLQGRYVFADYTRPGCYSFPVSAGPTAQLHTGRSSVHWHGGSPLTYTTTFGQGLDGELYIGGYKSGTGPSDGLRIYKLGPGCATADVGSAGGYDRPDGVLNNNDFVAFISLFFQSDIRADRGIAGGVPGRDGAFDNNDFIVFINLFFDGCT